MNETRKMIADLKSYSTGDGIEHYFKKAIMDILFNLEDRIRMIELQGMSFDTTERHFTKGEAIDAERRRVAEERGRARECRDELAEVEARLAGWGS